MSPTALLRLLFLAGVLFAPAALATDVDGPDCGRATRDFGDAPEGIAAGLFPGLARYPTCLTPGEAGTQEFACPPRGTTPGPTGHMQHVQSGAANYWLGCYDAPQGLAGIDAEADGKVSAGPAASACDASVLTDCALADFGQDECRLDGDAGAAPDLLIACYPNQLSFQTANCGAERVAYLNILVDLSFDGDWNDNLPCSDPRYVYCRPCDPGEECAHEWAVKNQPVVVPSGCASQTSPEFRVSAREGQTWMRISLTDEPVDDDYPWAGSAARPGGVYAGGETEDYVVGIIGPDPVRTETWGRLKLRYR